MPATEAAETPSPPPKKKKTAEQSDSSGPLTRAQKEGQPTKIQIYIISKSLPKALTVNFTMGNTVAALMEKLQTISEDFKSCTALKDVATQEMITDASELKAGQGYVPTVIDDSGILVDEGDEG